ncbi:response regulator transcription factor [Paenibacillus sp. GCM10027628]|uniref:response regulator transcription factor n=1 Tax=Paenibacillus sp. GCM10027628 TaxID=3273413 RepID=UPI0036328748
MHKVLLIEDDAMIGEMLSMYLSVEGYLVRRTETGAQGLAELEAFEPNIVLLDLVLPDIDGTKLCSDIRSASNVPILVVSMKTDVSERIQALMAGADDYICKPFSMRELTARITAKLRRTQLVFQTAAEQQEQPEDSNPIAGTAISLDPKRRSVYVNKQLVETTFSEFEILRLFCASPGKVFNRESLINALRGFDSFMNDRAIDVHIANLRKRIEEDPKEPRHIKTIRGVGYKFQP